MDCLTGDKVVVLAKEKRGKVDDEGVGVGQGKETKNTEGKVDVEEGKASKDG